MAGLYIHIPFCIKKCDYCDFVSYTCRERISEYIGALREEMRLRAQDKTIDSVFIGGGTPSVLPPNVILALLNTARSCFNIGIDAEISMECNPGTADAAAFDGYLNAGVNRLSIGVQSLDDALLKTIGRIHTAEQARRAVKDAQSAGFTNINVDLMYGLPGQTSTQHRAALESAAALGAEHISAYSLILEEGTPLFDSVHTGKLRLPDEDETYELHRQTIELLPKLGYSRYEISNYAQRGFECRHNLNYWNNGEYIGVGVAAHSAWREGEKWMRGANTASLDEYTVALQKDKLPTCELNAIPHSEEMFECVMLGLRKTAGLPLCDFTDRFGVELAAVYPKAVRELIDIGWLRLDAGFARLTDAGLDMQNEALLHFID